MSLRKLLLASTEMCGKRSRVDPRETPGKFIWDDDISAERELGTNIFKMAVDGGNFVYRLLKEFFTCGKGLLFSFVDYLVVNIRP